MSFSVAPPVSPNGYVTAKSIKPIFLPGRGKVHSGFHEFYATCTQTVIDTLNKLPVDIDTLLISGHSLGAAISTLALADIMTNTRFNKPIHYTYSSPRVGDPEFF